MMKIKIEAAERLKAARSEMPVLTEKPKGAELAALAGNWLLGLHNAHMKSFTKDEDFHVKLANAIAVADAFGIPKGVEIWNACKVYGSKQYGKLNKLLRAGQVPARAADIDAFLAVAKKTSPAVLYRGVRADLFGTLKEGQVVTDLAYVSTSSSEAIATAFAKNRGTKGGVLKITGVKNKVPYAVYNGGEDEYLMPRGCKFKVLSVSDRIATLKVISLPYVKVKKLPWVPVPARPLTIEENVKKQSADRTSTYLPGTMCKVSVVKTGSNKFKDRITLYGKTKSSGQVFATPQEVLNNLLEFDYFVTRVKISKEKAFTLSYLDGKTGEELGPVVATLKNAAAQLTRLLKD
jgi:hypothetical protein